MYNVKSYIILAAVIALGCQQTMITNSLDEEDVHEKEKISEPVCTENNESEACTLELTEIEYDLPTQPCEPYEQIVVVNTTFFAPAGLNEGSITRFDWEFLPEGNAGFWVSNIDVTVPGNSSGSIDMSGCFTFGEQEELRITRTISDELGNESNSLTITIPRTNKAKAIAQVDPGFEVINTYFGN